MDAAAIAKARRAREGHTNLSRRQNFLWSFGMTWRMKVEFCDRSRREKDLRWCSISKRSAACRMLLSQRIRLARSRLGLTMIGGGKDRTSTFDRTTLSQLSYHPENRLQYNQEPLTRYAPQRPSARPAVCRIAAAFLQDPTPTSKRRRIRRNSRAAE